MYKILNGLPPEGIFKAKFDYHNTCNMPIFSPSHMRSCVQRDEASYTVFCKNTFYKKTQACCPTKHERKMSRLAIFKIIRAKHQNRASLLISPATFD